MIRLVTIDCWDTILRNGDVWDALFIDVALKTFRVECPNITRQTVKEAFSSEDSDFSRILANDMTTPVLRTRLMRLASYAHVRLSDPTLHQLQKTLEEAILRPPPEVIPGARKFLERVKKRPLKVGLICNTGWFSAHAVDTALQRCDVARFFDFFAYSDMVGSAKPSPRIFEFALSSAECRPEEAIHIGDKFRTDIVGALNAGLGAIHFLNGETCIDEIVHCASDFEGIWAILSARLALP